MKRDLNQLTLREMFSDTERLTAELADHLELGFLPKNQQLIRLVRVLPEGVEKRRVEDISVRNQASELLKSHQFARELFDKLDDYLEAIEQSINRIIDGE